MIKRTSFGLAASLLFAAGLIGCGGSAIPRELIDARRAYGQAQESPAASLEPTQLYEARKALNKAEAAYNEDDGIRVTDSRLSHEIVSNECVNNAGAGIHLGVFDPSVASAVQPAGPHDNLVKNNWCVFNERGIAVDHGPYANTITNNTALANFDSDMFDDNTEPPCENTWFLNFFLTKDGASEDCIF